MINITRGNIENHVLSDRLVDYFEKKSKLMEGNLFLGYPILPTGDSSIIIDALFLSKKYGVIAFVFYDGVIEKDFTDIQDEVFASLLSKLSKEKFLSKRGRLLISLEVVTYAPNANDEKNIDKDGYTQCNNPDSLDKFLENLPQDNCSYYAHALRSIQSIATMKKLSSREKVKANDSKGGKLKKLEKHVANLDNRQMSAALEISENVQRIRGLAGSGKTIVLALKAAILHVRNPELKIAITFNTRSLKQQLVDLVTRFVFEQSESIPNWDNLKILHAWGSPREEGIYYNFCVKHEHAYLDFGQARHKSSYETAFSYACKLAVDNTSNFKEMYDVILIDEAQDFSSDFIKLCYEILPEKKRLVYAYDELQSLTTNSMESPENIFGTHKDKTPRVKLENIPGKAREDITLDVCYRNSRPLLTTAHALGFRLYGDIVQMFDDKNLWLDIGYEVESGELEDNHQVVLKRTSKSSPSTLESHSTIDDLIIFKALKNDDEQAKLVANSIYQDLQKEELEYKDILVVHTDPKQTQNRVGKIRGALMEKGINSHLAGVSTSPDQFFVENSIAFTSIYRAKGNEAAMVYVVDGQFCATDESTAKSRNILFTAITRSRAWVRVFGVGSRMENLVDEYQKIKNNDFKLEFIYPDKATRERLNIIHRDKSYGEEKNINNKSLLLAELVNDIKEGNIYKEDLPEDTLNELKRLLSNE